MCVSVKATCFQNVVVSRFSSVVVCRSLSHACIWICEGGCFCTKTSCDFQIALAGDLDGGWGGTLDTEAGTLGRRPAAGRHVRRLSNTVFCHHDVCCNAYCCTSSLFVKESINDHRHTLWQHPFLFDIYKSINVDEVLHQRRRWRWCRHGGGRQHFRSHDRDCRRFAHMNDITADIGSGDGDGADVMHVPAVVIVECICQVVVGHWRSLTS